MPADPNLLKALVDARDARLAAARAELEAVAALRTAKASWQEIADALGMGHRQEAQKKYGKHLVEEQSARFTVAAGAEASLR